MPAIQTHDITVTDEELKELARLVRDDLRADRKGGLDADPTLNSLHILFTTTLNK